MTKLIVVVGASGQQGGGVVNILLKTPGWKVRAITRNPSSDKGKELASKGAEVVSANLDDEASLLKAFEGAHAVFGVTNFWEHLFTGKSQDESGELEAKQAWNLATAAAKTSTLEHYIWSTLPSAKKLSGGKHKCAHLDYKADVDDRIKKELPDLAKKTTFLFFGYYPSNMVFFPQMKPFELPNSYGKYLQIIPADPKSGIIVSGDMAITPGVWVRQILANPDKTHGKYASVAPEFLSWAEMVKIWSEVSGRQGVVIQTSREDFVNIWGVGGAELADQLEFGETVTDWTAGYPFVTKEELGIKQEEIPGLRQTLEGFKAIL